MTFLAWASVVWVLTFGVIVMMLIERGRGSRYAADFRKKLDGAVLSVHGSWVADMPAINQSFFRQLFHYVVHVVLSWFLRLLHWAERNIRAIVRLNRKKAIVVTAGSPDSHLQKVAAHKEESALSDPEKKSRKEAALRGDV